MYYTSMVSDDLGEGLLLPIDVCSPPPKTTSMVLVVASVNENSPHTTSLTWAIRVLFNCFQKFALVTQNIVVLLFAC